MNNDQLFSETRVAMGVGELLEDCYKALVKHYHDLNNTISPSVITIKVKITPDARRERFTSDISANTSPSPRKPAVEQLYGTVDRNGNVSLFEYDPAQTRMFDKSTD